MGMEAMAFALSSALICFAVLNLLYGVTVIFISPCCCNIFGAYVGYRL